jgi:hypothetical protein
MGPAQCSGFCGRSADRSLPRQRLLAWRGKGREKMNKLHIHGMTLVIVFSVSAVVASAASAAVTFLLAEWLSAGARITTAQSSQTSGELNLIDLDEDGTGVVANVLCSMIFDGTDGPVSENAVEEMLNLKGEAISKTALSGLGLSCVNTDDCTEPVVWAEELPWKSELELMVDGTETFFVDLLSGSSYYIECLILGVTGTELCTTPSTAIEIKNEAGGVVNSDFSDAFQALAELKLGACGERAETFEIAGLGTDILTSGAALTASSE